MNPNEKAEQARELFLAGHNCAQSVYAAFAEDMGMSRERALLLSGGLGGGLGGLRFTCGAFTAMVMVLSALRGYTDGADMDGKKRLYDHLRTEDGRVPASAVESAIMELFQSINVGKNSASSPN